MSVKRTIFKGDSLEVIKGLSKDIAVFLYDAKELETYSITLKKISEKSLMNSGLITDSLKDTKRCLLIITAGLDFSLEDLDLIMRVLTANTTTKLIKMASNCDESMKNTVKIQLYIVK